MRGKFLSAVLVLLFAAVLLAGCGENAVGPGGAETTDQSQIAGTLVSAPSLIEDGLFASSAPTALASAARGASQSPATPIEPHTFWRSISSSTRHFEFAFADTDTTGHPTTALVTVNWRLLGTLNIVTASEPPPEPDVMAAQEHIVRKPLDDQWVRRVLLKRVPPEGEGMDRAFWRIAAVTGVEVTSREATTRIVSLRVQAAGMDTTITDPLALILLRQILRFAPDEAVTLTVTTTRDDDVVLLYHAEQRERMANVGTNTYAGTLPAGSLEGWRHFGVNALSHGTLYDDAEPYDSKAWILPYVIATTPEVDYLP